MFLISADKIFQRTKYFGGQNFSVDKIFGSNSNFWQFYPPKFCPIRYLFIKESGEGCKKKLFSEKMLYGKLNDAQLSSPLILLTQ